ncbi:MAG: PAS domain S-box protein, partial [Planctomycetia bacterium]|nr:PAS domain S-box protein [Planctomycetia bacterium]
LASSDVGTIFLDRKFCLRRFTPAVRRLLRVIPSDIGRPIRDFARNFTDDELLTDSERVLQTLIPIEKEIQDAEGHWYIRRILPYRTDDDRIEGVVINFTDITRRKEDEQALRDAAAQLEQRVHQRTSDLESANVSLLRGEQRFRTLLESAPDAMLVVEHGGEIAQVNRRAEQLFGYTRDELLGRPFETLIPQSPSGENERQRADFFSAPQDESAALGARLVGMRKDKSEFPIDIQFSPLDVNDRQFSIAAIRDMTQRERASEALSRLAAIMEGASAAIVVTSLDGTIQHWNEGAAHLFGYAAAEAVGYSVSMLASENDALGFPRLVERLRAGQRFEEYHTMTHKDGALLDVAATASLIDDASGQATGVCIVARDFGERKRLEQLIAELTDQERQRLGRELHDSVSQQIRGISMLLATLKAQMGETAQGPILERLENTIDETKRQLRALTKGVFPVDVDARGLRIALEELAQQVTATTGVSCRFECTDEVPLDDNFVATQLYLIAREAAFNAAKHSGGAMITIRLEDHEGGIQVSVRDNGKGLPELVERSDGMGLRIMRHRCGLLNGSLHFDAIAEGGTCVRCHVKRRNPT